MKTWRTVVYVALAAVGLCGGLVILSCLVGVGHGEFMKALFPNRSASRYADTGSFDGGHLSISPDGQYIIFASRRTGAGDIYRSRLDGTETVALTKDPNFEGDPSYSPDGRQIVFVREQNNIGHIWIMRADGTRPRQLTFGDKDDSAPLFEGDGKHILFTRETDDDRHEICWRMAADGSHQAGRDATPFITTEHASIWRDNMCWDGASDGMVLVNLGTSTHRVIGQGSSPAFSADGRYIVYLDGPINDNINIMYPDGTGKRLVYTSSIPKADPAFTKDGKTIIFFEDRGGSANVSTISLAGGDYRRLFVR